MFVYLAGPISGCSFAGCTEWREGVIKDLAQDGIIGVSPMRSKEYLSKLESISATGQEYAHMSAMSTPKGVTTRDRFDTQRATVVLVNLIGAKTVSIGTMIELGWADSVRVPVVLAMEPGNAHEHMMVESIAGFRLSTLEEAVSVVKAICRPIDYYQAAGFAGAGVGK